MFSTLSYDKNKYRSKLDDNLWVAVSQIKPQIDLLCSKHRAHCSHKVE